MNDENCIVKWMIGDKEIILAHGCRQIKNVCAAMNPNHAGLEFKCVARLWCSYRNCGVMQTLKYYDMMNTKKLSI